jgi:hypothetical protein
MDRRRAYDEKASLPDANDFVGGGRGNAEPVDFVDPQGDYENNVR